MARTSRLLLLALATAVGCGGSVASPADPPVPGQVMPAVPVPVPLASPIVADVHAHGAGCRENVPPSEFLRLMGQEGIDAVLDLAWGDALYAEPPLVDDPVSTPERLIHHDVEISFVPAASTGHLVILGPPSLSPELSRAPWGGPAAEWAAAHGGLVGMAHAGNLTEARISPDGKLPGSAVGLPVFVSRGWATFMQFDGLLDPGQAPHPPDDWWRTFRYVQQLGHRVAVAGGSDYPCLNRTLGLARTYAFTAGDRSYAALLAALRAGRTSAGTAGAGWIALRIAGPDGAATEVGGASSAPPGAVDLVVDADLPCSVAGQVFVNGEAAARVDLPAGRSTSTATVQVDRSAWISVVAPGILAGASYVEVNGLPFAPAKVDLCAASRDLSAACAALAAGGVDVPAPAIPDLSVACDRARLHYIEGCHG